MEKSNTINFTAGFERDTRDNQIAPTRGSFLRLTGLYAIQVGGRATRVLDGDFEARYYRPWGRYLVWAQGLRLVQVASLRPDRALPRSYWKKFGGEGSVRGVERDGIQLPGGGRAGINLRSEVRLYWRDLGVVAFWDRAQVWRRNADVDLGKMVDGYGMGLRYTMGIPFRFDLGLSRGLKEKKGLFFYRTGILGIEHYPEERYAAQRVPQQHHHAGKAHGRRPRPVAGDGDEEGRFPQAHRRHRQFLHPVSCPATCTFTPSASG